MTIDILPTVAHLAGAKLPAHPIDGKDIWGLMTGEAKERPHEALYYWWDRNLEAVRSGKWKLHFPHSYRSLAGKPGGKGGKPAAYVTEKLPRALFDLEKDPGETKNVATDHPDVVKKLEALAEKAREDLGDQATKRKGKGVREPGKE
jgi:arylsulfatase A